MERRGKISEHPLILNTSQNSLGTVFQVNCDKAVYIVDQYVEFISKLNTKQQTCVPKNARLFATDIFLFILNKQLQMVDKAPCTQITQMVDSYTPCSPITWMYHRCCRLADNRFFNSTNRSKHKTFSNICFIFQDIYK